ncbi:MAG: acyl carrier protein [Planctomycetota bacterium]|nr:acyl carrier protein [Planctomycetota bacterium]
MSEQNPSTAVETKEKIRAFLLHRFPAAANLDLDADASLLDSGVVDSLGILDVVAFLEETFGFEVDDDDLNPENFDNLAALERFAEERRG